MAERKETPDILSEILGGSAPPEKAASVDAPAPAPEPVKPKPAAKPRKRNAKAAAPKPASAGRREYRVVSFQEHRGWRARYVDGVELPGWLDGPLVHEYLAEMAAQGWELTGVTSGQALYGSSDKYQLFFSRAKT
ncbi:MAG: hypothetical protein ACK2UW_10070 [Anaerolineales bacterium]|jgi:hypothetical protein